MIDWVPVAFLTFKVLIFGACMFFAIPDGHPNSPAYGHLKLPHLN